VLLERFTKPVGEAGRGGVFFFPHQFGQNHHTAMWYRRRQDISALSHPQPLVFQRFSGLDVEELSMVPLEILDFP
jgi:hypothetical protein